MSCQDFEQAIHELADGTLDEAGRRRLDAHLATCAACRAFTDDVRAIRRAAGALETPAPPPSVWPRLAEQIGERGAPKASAGWPMTARWLAVAATLVVAVGAALVFIRSSPTPPPPAPSPAGPVTPVSAGNASPDEFVQGVETELQAAQRHYENALANLEQMAKNGRPGVDSQVAQTLRTNVALVDRAIQDSRAALRTDPQSEPARESLFEALRRKVALLQDTIALVNEMRKGNQAGAAAIVQGVQKS
jgi:hypothetical protein